MFLYYANEEVTTSLIVPLKQLNILNQKNISKNIEAVFFKLGTRNVHHKKEHIGTFFFVSMVLGLVELSLDSGSCTVEARLGSSQGCVITRGLYSVLVLKTLPISLS